MSMRLSETVEELALAHGCRLHRSWSASAEAIDPVRWKRGAGEARLAGGVIELSRRPEAGGLALRRSHARSRAAAPTCR